MNASDLVKMHVLIPHNVGGDPESSLLISCRVMPVLCVRGPHPEYQGPNTLSLWVVICVTRIKEFCDPIKLGNSMVNSVAQRSFGFMGPCGY